jgi:cell division protein FtsB
MDFRVNSLPTIRIKTFPGPERGLRAMMDRAPQAEALAASWIERSRPLWTRVYALRRRIATLTIFVVAFWLFIHVTFGANGMVIYRQKRSGFDQLQKQVSELKQENDRYADQIEALKTDQKAVEKEAREQLHYTRPGEYVYVAPGSASPAKPMINSAKK